MRCLSAGKAFRKAREPGHWEGWGVESGEAETRFLRAHMSQKNVLIEKAAGVAGDAKSLSKT